MTLKNPFNYQLVGDIRVSLSGAVLDVPTQKTLGVTNYYSRRRTACACKRDLVFSIVLGGSNPPISNSVVRRSWVVLLIAITKTCRKNVELSLRINYNVVAAWIFCRHTG